MRIVPVFEIPYLKLKVRWPKYRTLQGQPKSKVMMSIDSARVGCYLTFIDPIIISVTVFERSDVKFSWPWTSWIQGHPGSKFIVPIESPLLVYYLISVVSNIISLAIFEIFNFNAIFHVVKNYFRFRSGGHGYYGVPTKTTDNQYHTS